MKNPVCLFLPIEPRPENEKDMFVCPCNPQKKLLYRAFANHIVKRHNGKSPVFYMRRNQERIASEKENWLRPIEEHTNDFGKFIIL